MEQALAFQGITKRFPGVVALDDVSFAVQPGEIHALMGENGAGKSTLLKILAGDQRPDAGQMLIGATPHEVATPQQAIALGIRVISQEPNLMPHLSVAENIYLGRLPRRGRQVLWSELRRAAQAQIDRFGAPFGSGDRVAALSIAQRQMVEILKALVGNVRILALDEPTSSLSAQEIDHLLATLATLRQEGVAIVYVSHRIAEIFRISDRITVLRDGRHVGTVDTSATDEPALIRLMVGRELADVFATTRPAIGAPMLEVRGLRAATLTATVDFAVHRGEVLGIGGLIGAGRTEMVRALFGIDPMLGGEIRVDGHPVTIRGPRDAIAAGIALAPEDRKHQALVLQRSVAENITLPLLRRISRWRFVDRRRAAAVADRYIADLRIKTPDRHRKVVSLSGGNQQKVVLARWLALQPKVLILDEPTRGIDVGAKAEIYALVQQLAASGVATIVVSSDMVELLGLSDRILVMRGGAIAGELGKDEATEERVLRLAMVPQLAAAAVAE